MTENPQLCLPGAQKQFHSCSTALYSLSSYLDPVLVTSVLYENRPLLGRALLYWWQSCTEVYGILGERMARSPTLCSTLSPGPKVILLMSQIPQSHLWKGFLSFWPFLTQRAQNHWKTLWESREYRHHSTPSIAFDSFSRPLAQNFPFLHSETYAPVMSTYIYRQMARDVTSPSSLQLISF